MEACLRARAKALSHRQQGNPPAPLRPVPRPEVEMLVGRPRQFSDDTPSESDALQKQVGILVIGIRPIV